MSVTDVTPGPDGFLNDPPTLPGMPRRPGEGPPVPTSTTDVASAIAQASAAGGPPLMPEGGNLVVELPGGWVTPEGVLVTKATVRELNGYDEEKLARLDASKNIAKYITELCLLGTEELGGTRPDRSVILQLLGGDRDALLLGIRRATYGDTVEFPITCDECSTVSQIGIELDDGKDIKITRLEDPLVRSFDVSLRHGVAKVVLVTGKAQEAFSDDIVKKTAPEINTVLLANSVISINDQPVMGRTEDVLRLSSADRETLITFITDHQPGPEFANIPVNCAKCGKEYPISLGLSNLFRF